jgi:hypothetical protein
MADNKPTNAPLDQAPVDEIELAKAQQEETPSGYHDISDEYPAKKRKRALFKMDIRIIPVLMALYYR